MTTYWLHVLDRAPVYLHTPGMQIREMQWWPDRGRCRGGQIGRDALKPAINQSISRSIIAYQVRPLDWPLVEQSISPLVNPRVPSEATGLATGRAANPHPQARCLVASSAPSRHALCACRWCQSANQLANQFANQLASQPISSPISSPIS